MLVMGAAFCLYTQPFDVVVLFMVTVKSIIVITMDFFYTTPQCHFYHCFHMILRI